MAKITVSKEKECEMLWRFVTPASENVTSLASALAKTREVIAKQYKALTDTDEPDWKEISLMLLGTTKGFMDFVKDYCLAYANMLQELRGSLSVSEETNEGAE
jgi:hypothetical protein